ALRESLSDGASTHTKALGVGGNKEIKCRQTQLKPSESRIVGFDAPTPLVCLLQAPLAWLVSFGQMPDIENFTN
ncbi:hypothetical protein STEG23_012781, partial [Scotinomys teguina]